MCFFVFKNKKTAKNIIETVMSCFTSSLSLSSFMITFLKAWVDRSSQRIYCLSNFVTCLVCEKILNGNTWLAKE